LVLKLFEGQIRELPDQLPFLVQGKDAFLVGKSLGETFRLGGFEKAELRTGRPTSSSGSSLMPASGDSRFRRM
jgi:hypothetical protein